MGIANIGGAASPQVIYGKNSTGAALEPGDVVEIKGDLVTVMFGAFKTKVKRNQLTWLR